MAGVNKVVAIGRLGRDPEMLQQQSGGKIARFSVACDESWTDRTSGERKQRTEWITVVVFSDGLAKVAEQFLRKGSQVYVEGKYRTRKYTGRDGIERYATEVAVENFGGNLVLLDRAERAPAAGSADDYGAAPPDADVPF